MDDADLAQRNEDIFREEALVKHFRKAAEAGATIDELKICTDCGGRIPEGRLVANPRATRCITCQKEKERENGHHADRHD